MESFDLIGGYLTICTTSCSSPQWLWFGMICTPFQSPGLFRVCASQSILNLCSSGEELFCVGKILHGWTLISDNYPPVWTGSTTKNTLRLTFISGRTKQQQAASSPSPLLSLLTSSGHWSWMYTKPRSIQAPKQSRHRKKIKHRLYKVAIFLPDHWDTEWGERNWGLKMKPEMLKCPCFVLNF